MNFSLPSDLEYGSLFNYSPRGKADLSKWSRDLSSKIKAGKMIDETIERLFLPESEILAPFLNKETTLVPIPGSSLYQQGNLWPSLIICEKLVVNGLGSEVFPCLKRKEPIRKSHLQIGADNRPSVNEHKKTIEGKGRLIPIPQSITLIDDVLTLGRTAYACYEIVQSLFPEAKIRLFTMMRTQGFQEDILKLRDPSIGVISFNPGSGKTSRNP